MIAPVPSKLPRHVGFILDGNRRFAKRLMLKPWKGHEWGAKKVEQVLQWCKDKGIEEATLYALSIENFSRPKEEFDTLMNIFREECDALLDDKRAYNDKSVRVRFIGRLWMLPKDLHEKMQRIMELTAGNKPYTVNFAIAYGGRAEVLDATRKIAAAVKEGRINVEDINEEVFRKALYIESEPDLIIRTSGEQRTSGFLLWQSSYAELHFSDKLWPEFEEQDLDKALAAYAERDRRFGK
jgi:tritrans,polycis-undecaprenyl-diphosphate synthase [geranylgeranyl-diphosphate specific]